MKEIERKKWNILMQNLWNVNIFFTRTADCRVVLSLSDAFFDVHLIAKAPIAWKSFQKALENFPSYRRDLLLHSSTLKILSVGYLGFS